MNDYTESWDTILAAIRNTADGELACNQIPDELFAAYAETVRLQEEIVGQDLLAVQTHLQQCPDCSQLLADLVETLGRTEEMLSLALPPLPPFDLDFLTQGAARGALPEGVLQAFAQGRRWARDFQGVLWIDLDVKSAPGSTPDYLPVTKGSPDRPTASASGQAGEVLYYFAVGTEDLGDLDVEVVGKRQDKTEFCTITVKAIVPSRWPEIGGIEVEVVSGSRVYRCATGPNDRAVFADIPIGDLPRTYVRLLTG